MTLAEAQTSELWPLGLYTALAVVMVAGMLVASYVLGGRRRHDRAQPYESGMLPTGSARLRFSADFYLVAMFFVIFDLESVFLFAWAICLRQVGWAGYAEAMVFIGVLVAGLIYLWRIGALDWASPGRSGRDSSSTQGPSRESPR